MRRWYLVLAAAPAVALAAACGGGDGGTDPTRVPTTITLSPPAPDSLFSIGQTLQLTAVVRDQNNQVIQSPSVAWTSSATAIATVHPTSGLVTAAGAGPGSTTIRAVSGSAEATVDVKVRQKFDHVTVTPSARTLAPSEAVQLTAQPQDARNNNMTGLPAATWTSSNTAVAEVSGTGRVTAKTTGPATITATIVSTADGSKQGTSAITVQNATVNATVVASSSADEFVPPTVTISPGGQVTWQFGTRAHNVEFDPPPSGAPAAPSNVPTTTNGSVTRTFSSSITARTTYTYECGLHAGMTGSVVVQP